MEFRSHGSDSLDDIDRDIHGDPPPYARSHGPGTGKTPDRTGNTAPARDTGDTGDGDRHDGMERVGNRIGRDETNIDTRP